MPRPNEHDVYSIIGFVLCYIQSVERSIKFCTRFVLQDKSELTWERLQSTDAKERKKALGYFIGLVKNRVHLHPAFEILIDEFLQERNDFVHNQDQINGWDLRTEDGVIVARTYAMTLLRKAHKVNEILAALMNKWAEQAGINVPVEPRAVAYMDELEKKYGWLVDVIFTSKDT